MSRKRKPKPQTDEEFMAAGLCPRCHSAKKMSRLDGSTFCKRCGQRWKNGKMMPSFDRRTISHGEVDMEEEGAVSDVVPELVVLAPEKKRRGRPEMPVGTVRTRKDGTIVKKGVDGKWHKVQSTKGDSHE